MGAIKSFKDLQAQWYEKLREEGYLDIENTNHPSRPLKEWHSFKMTSQRFQIIQANRSQYQKQIDDFINHPDFAEACRLMVKHGNCKFKQSEVMLIWELHTKGYTTRKIARQVGRVKSRVDDVLKGLREWMKIL